MQLVSGRCLAAGGKLARESAHRIHDHGDPTLRCARIEVGLLGFGQLREQDERLLGDELMTRRGDGSVIVHRDAIQWSVTAKGRVGRRIERDLSRTHDGLAAFVYVAS